MRRDRKRDFASGDGDELLACKVEQVLATLGATNRTSCELPWRTSFGSQIDLLRHQRNDAVLAELARVYVRDALRKWVPEVHVQSVTAERDGSALLLRVSFRKAAGGAVQRVAVPLVRE
jgi:hypothetical protein